MNSANPTSGASILVKKEMPKDVNCTICLEPFNDRAVKPVIVKTRCGHYFDEDCITNWLNSPNVSRSCAVCRQPTLPLQRVSLQGESDARLHEDSPFIEDKPLQDCRNGDLEALQEWLRIEPGIVHRHFRSAIVSKMVTLLAIAVCKMHTDCVQALLAGGANPNAPLERGTLLKFAVCIGHHKIVEALLEAGAKPNETKHTDGTALYMAASYGRRGSGRVGIMKALIKAGANPNTTNESGRTPLHAAATYVCGRVEIVDVLLEAGADPNATDHYDTSVLHAASQYGRTVVVKALLEAGADPNKAREDGSTALHLAARRGRVEMVSTLIKAGADINAKQKDGKTPLCIAAMKGHDNCVQELERASLDIHRPDQ